MDNLHAFGFDAFLSIIERNPGATSHVALWQRRLGVPLVSLFRAMGVLWECAQVDWYPCESGFEGSCRRRVVANTSNVNNPFLALPCGHEQTTQDPTPLGKSDVFTLAFSREAFIRELRGALDIAGEFLPLTAPFPRVYSIGTLRGRPVFLALLAGNSAFETWLAAQTNAFVLIPTGRRVTDAVHELCSTGRSTELVVLRRILGASKKGLIARWPVKIDEKSAMSRASTIARQGPVQCVVYSHNGRQELTSTELRNLVADPSQYDLFLDLTDLGEGGRHRANKRNSAGKAESVLLSRNEALALVELVQAGRSLEPRDFRSVVVSHVVKLVERARNKIDIKHGRYTWRAIKTQRGTKAFRFQPPATMKWLVVVELERRRDAK